MRAAKALLLSFEDSMDLAGAVLSAPNGQAELCR